MTTSTSAAFLARFTIDEAGQKTFTDATGDYNPIHSDFDAARRTIFGQVVAHGMNVALTMLEHAQAKSPLPLRHLSQVTIQFAKPALLGDEIDVFLLAHDARSSRLVARAGTADLVKLRLTYDMNEAINALPALELAQRARPAMAAPRDRAMDEPLPTGSLTLQVDGALLSACYPNLIRSLGERTVATLALLSSIVGMEWPGLRSLFVEAKIKFKDSPVSDLSYAVTETDRERALTSVKVEAPDLTADLTAFFRPPSVDQPSAIALAGFVDPDLFKGLTVIVIGGSRGLGEIAAKLLAMGGADVFLTSRSPDGDMKRVARSIEQAGRVCRTAVFDTGNAAERLPIEIDRTAPVLLLYFASPHIFRRRSMPYARAWFDEFVDVYLDGFVHVMHQVMPMCDGKIGVLYPSTEALDQPFGDLLEYAAAKAAGEAVCRALAVENPRLSISVPRLPRLLTDQTNSITAVETADPVDVLLPLLVALAAAVR